MRRYLVLPTHDPFALVGVAIYAVFILVALLAPWLATHDPLEILFLEGGKLARSVPPGAEHYLGTTNLGRDIYSQLVYGTQGALVVGSRRRSPWSPRHHGRPGRRLLRRLDRQSADAARRHRARHPVPALRRGAGGLPRAQHVERGARDRAAALAQQRPGDPEPGALRARARLRRGRGGLRRVQRAKSCSSTSRPTSCR